MTPLDALVRETIERDGPMPVDAWMNLVLNHPAHGYYTTRQPIGARGDFTTAPEISQMFGELIAAWSASAVPDAATLVEIGPGRGTLMVDMARTAKALPGFAPALHLIETSPSLREQQAETLTGVEAHWHNSAAAFATKTSGPFALVANELLDALPARQLVRHGGQWHERVVAIVEERLAFALGPPLPKLRQTAPDGTILELAPAREALVDEIANMIAERGGAALFIDYGSRTGGTGDTLQAVRDHREVDPLEAMGEADLTTHVDFVTLAAVARRAGCQTAATTQGKFLLELGLLERAGALGHAEPSRQEAIRGQVERLAGPDEMGELFKVVALWHPDRTRPPGFGPEL